MVMRVLRDPVTILFVTVVGAILIPVWPALIEQNEKQLTIVSLIGAEVTWLERATNGLLSLSISDKSLSQATFIRIFDIKNTGDVPLKPSNITKPLSVTTQSGTSFLGIQELPSGDSVEHDITFKGQRTGIITWPLLNPGDKVRLALIITAPEISAATPHVHDMLRLPAVGWEIRIPGMRETKFSTDPLFAKLREGSPVFVFLFLEDIITILVLATVFLALLSLLLFKVGWFNSTAKCTATVTVAAALSFSCAESVTFILNYSHSNIPIYIMNWIAIALYVATALTLFVYYAISSVRYDSSQRPV